MEVIHKALWVIGAAQVSPVHWHCWLCLKETPGAALAAEHVRTKEVRVDLIGFSTAQKNERGWK